MTAVAVFSVKGAPGATTAALALTAAMAGGERRALLVEADDAGGDLAGMLGRPVEAGMTSLAASSRHEATRPDVAPHVQPLPSGGLVLLGSTDPVEAGANLTTLARRLPDALAEFDVVVDAGRLSRSSPALPLVERAEVKLVCLTATVPSVEAVATRRIWLAELIGQAGGLVVIGDCPYDDGEIASSIGLPVVSRLPRDVRGVMALVGGPGPSQARSHLVRAARTLLDRVASPLIGAPA